MTRWMNKTWLAALGALLLCGPAAARETGFLNRQLELDGGSHRYQIYVPADYSPAKAWPVILFLHGSGERGSDGLLQTDIGMGQALRRLTSRYPAIVVFPQSPLPASEATQPLPQGGGSPDEPAVPGAPLAAHRLTERIALGALAQTEAEFRTDADRVYLTGMSLGGSGALYLASQHSDRFAALVAVCGWVAQMGAERASRAFDVGATAYASTARKIGKLPVWLFHGDADTVVPVEQSRRMFAALKAAGANVRYTEIAGAHHNSWDAAYQSPDMPVWLLAQSRAERSGKR